MLSENYYKITTYLSETFGANFIFLIMGLTTVISIIYFVVISYIITQMDKRYFVRKKMSSKTTSGDDAIEKTSPGPWNSTASYVLKPVKIIVGIGLFICGLVMLVLPGQGLITLLIALSLLPFPGKDNIEQKLLARHSVRSSLNWIRIKASKEPFIFD